MLLLAVRPVEQVLETNDGGRSHRTPMSDLGHRLPRHRRAFRAIVHVQDPDVPESDVRVGPRYGRIPTFLAFDDAGGLAARRVHALSPDRSPIRTPVHENRIHRDRSMVDSIFRSHKRYR